MKSTTVGATSSTRSPVTKPAPATEPTISREERLVAWIKANQKYLGVAAAGLAVVLVATWFLAVSSQRKAAFARAQLERAWNTQDAGNLPLASSELQRLATAYRGTSAAREAVLSLNQARLLNGQSQLAVDGLQEFIATQPPAEFLGPAYMLLGAAFENLAKPGDAAQAYQQAATTQSLDFQKGDALLAAARAWAAAGNRDQAVAALRTILEKYPTTASYPIAELRLAGLLAPGT